MKFSKLSIFLYLCCISHDLSRTGLGAMSMSFNVCFLFWLLRFLYLMDKEDKWDIIWKVKFIMVLLWRRIIAIEWNFLRDMDQKVLHYLKKVFLIIYCENQDKSKENGLNCQHFCVVQTPLINLLYKGCYQKSAFF